MSAAINELVITPEFVTNIIAVDLADETTFTTADKAKLNGIEAGAQVNTVTRVAGKTGAVELDAGDIAYDASETYASGKIGAALKSAQEKLDTIEEGAEVNAVNSVNSKSGDVVLNAGDIGYDGSSAYDSGTVGKELTELNRQISNVDRAIDYRIKNSEHGVETFYGYAEFMNFGLTAQGSYNANQRYRVSTTDRIVFDRDIKVSVASGFRWGIFRWVNDSGTWLGWNTSDYTIPAGTSFTVQIGRVSEVTSETADVLEFLSMVTFQTAYTVAINKTARLKTNDTFLDILHMGGAYNGAIGNDRIEAIEYNCKIGGFRVMEIDVQFTSDKIPVMIHLDANTAASHLFTDSSGNYVAVTVSENTFEQLQAYNYLGTKVAKLEDGIKVCKRYGIDVAIDKTFYFNSEKLTIVENIVSKMGMEDNIYFIGPSVATAQAMLSWNPKAKIIFDTTPTNWINNNSWVQNFESYNLASFYVMFENSSVTDANFESMYANKPNYMKLGVYTVDNITTYEKRFYQFAFIISNTIRATDLKDDVI